MCGLGRVERGRMRPRGRATAVRAPETTLREFLEVWHALRHESSEPGAVVVVEGERDRSSLRRLGISGSIVLVHRGVTLSATAHALSDRRRHVIVLTDWDREGGHLAQRLRGFLEADGLRLDLDHRRRLATVLRGEVVHVEGLAGWARRLADKVRIPLEELLPGAEDGSD